MHCSYFQSLTVFNHSECLNWSPVAHKCNALRSMRKLLPEQISEDASGELYCLFSMKKSEISDLVGWARRVLFIWLLKKCFVFPLLMLCVIWWQQISVKRDKNFYLWSFFKAHNEDTDDRINLLFVVDINCLPLFTVDYFHSQISAEAPWCKVQFWWPRQRWSFPLSHLT